jgi:titin
MAQGKRRRAARGRFDFQGSAEPLEPRALLAGMTFDVVTSADAGAGSLRTALTEANLAPGSTIDFNIQKGPLTINVLSPLPVITAPVLIDGTSQPGFAGTPLVTISSQIRGAPSSGLVFAKGSDGSTIQGLAVTRFQIAGIEVDGASNVTIGGDTRGLGNNLYGNLGEGLLISGAGASGNTAQGNIIGLDASAETALANGNGVVIDLGATGNFVGGTVAEARNVISGNLADGVLISGAGTSGNTVEGNAIGTDGTATKAIGNADGVAITLGATANTIGGVVAASKNVISGNTGDGVLLSGAGVSGNLIEGDLIGLCNCTSGQSPLGNHAGVEINSAATANTVGGTITGSRNVISSNTTDGVLIVGAGTEGNIIDGNFLGTATSGQTPLGNDTGVEISGSATANVVGGTVPSARNLISGNLTAGVGIFGILTSENLIEGNTIGAGVSGQSPLPNGIGVEIASGALANVIGGTSSGAGNLISGNTGDGVLISGSGTSGNGVLGNLIGTGISGQTILANANGVEIAQGATTNLVGGSIAGARNIISGNTSNGVLISGSGTSGNLVEGSYIGTDSSGQRALGNDIGVLVTGGSANRIGFPNTGDGNVISGNFTTGIEVRGAGATGTTITDNFIGTNPAGTAAVVRSGQTNLLQALQNAGIAIIGSQGNVIGGTSLAARNLISGNYVGVNFALISAHANPNILQGNLIGTDASGAKPLGNIVGIYVNGAAGNVIGGSLPGSGNVISANTSVGVEILGSGSTGNLIENNLIGPAANGQGAFRGRGRVFTQGVGVFIQDSSGNLIGGASSGTGNVISGNDSAGVFIFGLSGVSRGNTVKGNLIGLSQSGSPTLGNAGYGIVLDNAPNNTLVLTGASANRFGRNGIENIRILGGPSGPSSIAARPGFRRSHGLGHRSVRIVKRSG